MQKTGTVKWFNDTKGYGFIAADDGGDDIFVHIKAVQKAGMHTLNEGQQVEFEEQTDPLKGKTSAANLKALIPFLLFNRKPDRHVIFLEKGSGRRSDHQQTLRLYTDQAYLAPLLPGWQINDSTDKDMS